MGGWTAASVLPTLLATFLSNSFAELMTKEFFIRQRTRRQLALQQLTEFFCLDFFSLSGCFVRQRRLELRQFAPAKLVVQPCCPFFLKRFHKRLSVGFAIFCVHKTSGTSLSRSNIPRPLRSRDTAFHRSPSLRSQRGVRARA